MTNFKGTYYALGMPIALISLVAVICLIVFQFKSTYNDKLRRATLWLIGIAVVGNLFLAGAKAGLFACHKIKADNNTYGNSSLSPRDYPGLGYPMSQGRKRAYGGGVMLMSLFVGVFLIFTFPYLSASQCHFENNEPTNKPSTGLRVFTWIALFVTLGLLLFEFYVLWGKNRTSKNKDTEFIEVMSTR